MSWLNQHWLFKAWKCDHSHESNQRRNSVGNPFAHTPRNLHLKYHTCSCSCDVNVYLITTQIGYHAGGSIDLCYFSIQTTVIQATCRLSAVRIISSAVEMPLSPCCQKRLAAERLPYMFTLSHPHTLIIRQLPAAVCLTEPNHYLPLISCSDTACCG